ncbi:MAG: hypothetical protein ACTTGJ_04275 [Clostridium sp.]
MQGKKTNIFIGIINILCGIAILIYIYYYMKYGADLNRHQKIVFDIFKISTLGIATLIAVLNVVYSFLNIKEGHLFIYYLLAVPSLIIYWHLNYISPLFFILSGILIILYIRKNKFIKKENFVLNTLNIVLLVLIILNGILITQYTKIAIVLKARENVNTTKYDSEFFKFITPIEDKSVYINMVLNNKYGYIDALGKTRIEFKYEYATPFYNIKAYNKEFKVAAVSQGKLTKVILKNEREVMSYNSEYDNSDYSGKIEEFENILKNEMKIQEYSLETKIDEKSLVGLYKRGAYSKEANDKQNKLEEEKLEKQKNDDDSYYEDYFQGKKEGIKRNYLTYTHRFDFNQKYDILVTESKLGEKTIYKIAPKGHLRDASKLDVEKLLYDEKGLYIFDNGTIPYYSPSKKESGWITSDGKKRKITGNAQILYMEKDKIAIKNNDRNVSYFISTQDNTGTPISQMYKEIIKDKDKYIVKTNNDKWQILDLNFNKMIPEEYDIFKPELLSLRLYIFANLPQSPKYNEYGYMQLNYTVYSPSLHKICINVEKLYNLYFKYNEQKENYEQYIQRIKRVDFPKLNENIQ